MRVASLKKFVMPHPVVAFVAVKKNYYSSSSGSIMKGKCPRVVGIIILLLDEMGLQQLFPKTIVPDVVGSKRGKCF